MAEAETQAEAPERNIHQIAAERFGRNFHGEVPEPQEPPQEPAQEPEEPVEPEAASEEPQGGPQEEATEEEVIQSWHELIEAQGWDPEWAQSLRVPVKVDGEQTEATFEDLVRSYQTQTAAEKRLEDAKAKAKAIRDEAQQRQEESKAQIAVLGQLIQTVEQNLVSQYDPQEMERLRQEDPAEWSARNAERAQKQEGLDGLKRQALTQYQQSLAEQQQQEQAKKAEHLQAEQAALLEALPSWSDPETAKAEQTKLVGYLTDQGFAQEDVMGASDHRLILLARKAMLYDQGQQATDVAAKKVAKVPKVLKPGAPKPQEQINQEKERALRRKVRTAKSSSSGINAAMELMRTRRS